MPFKYPSMAERLIANSVIDDARWFGGSFCWTWIGSRNDSNGGLPYGKLEDRYKKGPRKGQRRTRLAHRAAVEVFTKRRLSQRQVVMHLCNWSLCINPEHLLGGTQRKNVRQCVKDGRHRNGQSAANDERLAA